MDNPLYVSKHWSVTEWDCWRRSKNDYAWDNENSRLCTNDEKTANLFRIFDMLRDWNPNWVINTTSYHEEYGASFKSGFRTVADGVNTACGGEVGSYHTRGCAADIHISGQDDTDTALADTVIAAAKAWGIEDQLGIGYYGNWIHVDTRGYTSRW